MKVRLSAVPKSVGLLFGLDFVILLVLELCNGEQMKSWAPSVQKTMPLL